MECFPFCEYSNEELAECQPRWYYGRQPPYEEAQHKKWKTRYRYDKPQKYGKTLEYYCSYGRNQFWPLVIICNNNFFNQITHIHNDLSDIALNSTSVITIATIVCYNKAQGKISFLRSHSQKQGWSSTCVHLQIFQRENFNP